jgi:hypothetical protein
MVMTKEVKKIGRPAGSPNKRTEELFHLADKHDCDPFEILILFAKGDYESLGYPQTKTITTKDGSTFEEWTISPELRQKSARDAAEYLYPKRKAIEHTGKDGEKLPTFEDYIKGLNGAKEKA